MMVKCKRRRRRLVKLRGGTAELEVETGRWRGVRREERICKNCRGGEVEDVRHLVMRCTCKRNLSMHSTSYVHLIFNRVFCFPQSEQGFCAACIYRAPATLMNVIYRAQQ